MRLLGANWTAKDGAVVDRMSIGEAAGAAIPQLGLGTFQLRGEQCARLVAEALAMGYAHIDTAQGYANEEAVGEGLAAAGRAGEMAFVTTKVQPQNLGDGMLQRSVEASLTKLRRQQIDLLLIHWPNPAIPLKESIAALNKVKRDGLVRHIGLSNFTAAMLDEAWRLTAEPFAAEQIEYHPFLEQRAMLSAIRRHGMAVIAYSPLALGGVVGEPAIEAIAKAHHRSAAQVTLRWLIQQPDVVAIPRTSKSERLRENLAIFDFQLTEEEMATMNALTRPNSRLINEPQWVPEWD